MPKKIFWPATLVTMGLVFLATNMGLLPQVFWNLWAIILIVVGLGGLITSDRDEWLFDGKRKKSKTSSKKRRSRKKRK